MGLLVTVKGTPSTYNKDLQVGRDSAANITSIHFPDCRSARAQEDKEPLFDCADTLRACSQIADGVVTTLKPNKAKMLSVSAAFGSTPRVVLSRREPRFCHSPLPCPWEWELPKLMIRGRLRGFRSGRSQLPLWWGRQYPSNILSPLLLLNQIAPLAPTCSLHIDSTPEI